MKYELGIKAKDIITGFEGTVTGFCTYLTGCDQYLLAPPVDNDGKHVDSRWYDEKRIQPTDGEKMNLDKQAVDGPCKAAPIY